MRNLLILTICLAIMVSYQDTLANTNNSVSTPNANTKPVPAKIKNLFFCPNPSALQKNPADSTWTAEGGWKSYTASMVTQVTQFLGAQWHGTEVGQITCVYQGKPALSFPILLIFHTLTKEPYPGKWNKNIDSKWSKNLGGFRNCKANEPKNCPFKMQLKPKEANIYKEAEELKNNSDNLTNPGF